MVTAIKRSVLLTLVLGFLLCAGYPLLVMGLGKLLFNNKANGGMIVSSSGQKIGAELIGQNFTRPEYFHGRPSGAGNGYDAANSSGTNLAPTNQKLADTVKGNVEKFLKENPTVKQGEVPVDSVTASGSGLDPHISPESARAQTARVAQARGIPLEKLHQIVEEHVEGPQLLLFGEPAVNVLLLNLDLDKNYPVNERIKK